MSSTTGSTTTTERRNHLDIVELRAEGDAAPDGSIAVAGGYAAVFGKRSQELYGFTELVDPGAFTKTVDEADVLALWNHREDDLLGRTSAQTLRLAIDERGLGYEVDVPDITVGRDLVVRLKRKDVRGSSFGFRTIRDEWYEDPDDGAVTRTLLEVRLIDVSPVTRPAYIDTEVALRSLARATDHPFAEVRQLAESRSLATILDGSHVETEPELRTEEEDGRHPTTVHRPQTWLTT